MFKGVCKTLGLVMGLCFGAAGAANAAIITADSATGNGTFNNSADVLIDGLVTPETRPWNYFTNVYWTDMASVSFVVDLGSVHLLEDLVIAADNNDDYWVETSLNGISWSDLFTIDDSYGNVPETPVGGTDIFSTINSDPEFVSELDFSPLYARYIRISATDGDGQWAVGEVQAHGTPAPVPLPPAYLLMGCGLIGLIAISKPRKSHPTH